MFISSVLALKLVLMMVCFAAPMIAALVIYSDRKAEKEQQQRWHKIANNIPL